MNILWIEDFGGRLPTNEDTLKSFFKDFIDFDEWDSDELNFIKRPLDLTTFCQQKSVHGIWLCRNYFDYDDFKKNHSIVNEIDVVITDVRLDENVDLGIPIPAPYESKYEDPIKSKSEFHENAGFYIFNDLIHLGVPAEKMCFMTGEKNSFKNFEEKCAEIYTPKVNAFEKSDSDFAKLRIWLKGQESDYVKLRRGIIEGCCNYITKSLTEDKIAFNNFISENEKIVNLDEARDYLEVLEKFLPLREVNDKATLYKLLVRTLSHEWEAADPKKREWTGLAWIMKNTRNWIVHNSTLFSDLDEKMVAYLFMVNMRLMFSFDDAVQNYEKILLGLFSENALSEDMFKTQNTTRDSNKVLFVNQNIKRSYVDLQNLVSITGGRDAIRFSTLANNIQDIQSRYRNDKQLFSKLLYQMFWHAHSNAKVKVNKGTAEIEISEFVYPKHPHYLFEIARHISNDSFPQ
jgi:hypothetical protein